jgi:probable DNA repair protein
MMEAWDLLHLYGLSLDQCGEFYLNETMESFIACARYFKELCLKNGWITLAEIPHFFNQNFSKVSLQTPICLLGFLEKMPLAIKRLIDHCQSLVSVISWNSPEKNAEIFRFEYTDTQSELYQMAHWAIGKWQSRSNARIACIVPQLSQLRAKVQTVFEEMFIRLSDDSFTSIPFNISIGQPLIHFELVKTAITLLSLPNESTLSLDYLLPPLYSAYGLSQTFVGSLDMLLRKLAIFAFSPKQFSALLETHFPNQPLTIYWRSYLKQLRFAKARLSARQWSNFFLKQLEILQWPCFAMTPDEMQVAERFLKAIIEFSKSDIVVNKPLSLSEALMLLKSHLRQIIFQPSEGVAHSIQILGLLEAVGHTFDAIWIMGLDDQTWPAHPKPNLLLPFSLQKKFQMPHYSYAHELSYAQALQQYFFTHASEVVVSYSITKNNQTVSASPLIRDIPLRTPNEIVQPIEVETARVSLESIGVQNKCSIQRNENVKGGCALLKDQALCPFRAFAHFRLNAKEASMPALGVSPLHRGQWVHAALEHFWKQVKSHENLMALTDDALNEVMDEAVIKSQQRIFSSQIVKPTNFFITLEAGYLKRMLCDWIRIEKARPPFVVRMIEAWQKIAVGPLTLHVRMDRMDQLSDGSQLLIDYKTGQTQLAHWFDDCLREPQLPLYCAFGLGNIHGIAFAELSTKGVQFKGASAHEMDILGVQPVNTIKLTTLNHWNELRTYWATRLIELANQFYEGHNEVSPVDAQACRYCDLQALCRIE